MKIKLKHIVKIQAATIRQFEALDSDYPNLQIASANARAIEHYLDMITKDTTQRAEILHVIESNNSNTQDITFKPICDELRSLGYEIIGGKK